MASEHLGRVERAIADAFNSYPSPEELSEAKAAAERLRTREGEDPEEWAEALGRVFASYRD